MRNLFIVVLILTTTFIATAQKYTDGRPEAVLRMDAKDHGIVLKYGSGPDKCDILGARDVWVFEDAGPTICTTMLPGQQDGLILWQQAKIW